MAEREAERAVAREKENAENLAVRARSDTCNPEPYLRSQNPETRNAENLTELAYSLTHLFTKLTCLLTCYCGGAMDYALRTPKPGSF